MRAGREGLAKAGRAALLLAGLGLAVAACAAAGRWENPDLPEDRWAGDRAACRSYASDKVEREVAFEQAIPGGGAFDSAGSLESAMASFDAIKRRDALFAACMRSRGYRKAGRQPG